jgi:hypothetical protein
MSLPRQVLVDFPSLTEFRQIASPRGQQGRSGECQMPNLAFLSPVVQEGYLQVHLMLQVVSDFLNDRIWISHLVALAPFRTTQYEVLGAAILELAGSGRDYLKVLWHKARETAMVHVCIDTNLTDLSQKSGYQDMLVAAH